MPSFLDEDEEEEDFIPKVKAPSKLDMPALPGAKSGGGLGLP